MKVPECCVVKGDFELRSGRKTDTYYDFKDVSVNGAKIYAKNIIDEFIYETVPVGAFLAGEGCGVHAMLGSLVYSCHIEGLLVRSLRKDYGRYKEIEGDIEQARRSSEVYLLQDVITTTDGSTAETLQKLINHGITVKRIITFVDRREVKEFILGTPVVSIWDCQL